ncbi:amidohydrolase [Fulvivirga sp. RKSG066]|uniref:amidohydrolase n=1 Tax=Fulvivirga aurantia TaxID=2529383 RepID=UPI0012BCCAA1|nr:amidohydrolase [Fulvivirga aurantia]MTI20440.1 amidohydrolase [Fulvivirga aurantia]
MTTNNDLQHLVELRRKIHKQPEISGEERETAKTIVAFVNKYNPDRIITDIGGQGIVAQFGDNTNGPAITIRAELDALPIQELNSFHYKSEVDQKGHLCGHDGHMVMVAALAEFLAEERPTKGVVNLLFQPAEETGQGAREMLNDPKFDQIKHDYFFALHNLPGYPKNSIIIRENVFASASKGVIINLKGKTSHAAEPENGNSPAQAVAEIIQQIKVIPDTIKGFSLVTIVHAKIGERAFGTTPGDAVVMATLRAYKDDDLKTLDAKARDLCENVSSKYSLACDFEETEVFSSTLNDPECVKLIKDSAVDNNLEQKELDQPFRWSEDFGEFTQKYKGAMFGLGSGEETPALHNPDYDFPDDIMQSGIGMFKSLIKKIAY